MCLFLLFLAAQGLTLRSGEVLVCDAFLVVGDRLVIQFKGNSYSMREDLVNWSIPVVEMTASENNTVPTLETLRPDLQPTGDFGPELVIEKLEVKEASLIDVLRLLADQVGFNLYIDSSVSDVPVTFAFRQIRWQDALIVLLGSLNLHFEFLTGEKLLQVY